MQNASLDRSPLWVKDTMTPEFKRSLVQLAMAVRAREPVLLLGPTSFKSLLVQTWCQITGSEADSMFEYMTSGERAAAVYWPIARRIW